MHDAQLGQRRDVTAEVLRFLESRGIVEGFYNEQNRWHAARPHSSRLFQGAEGEEPAFEYLILR